MFYWCIEVTFFRLSVNFYAPKWRILKLISFIVNISVLVINKKKKKLGNANIFYFLLSLVLKQMHWSSIWCSAVQLSFFNVHVHCMLIKQNNKWKTDTRCLWWRLPLWVTTSCVVWMAFAADQLPCQSERNLSTSAFL